jgi:hypothetical protein
MMAGMAQTDEAGGRPRAEGGTSGAQQFCDQCGKPVADASAHGTCAARRELEPPRFCPQCARRMVVQIVPTGWTARCSVHGELSSASAAAS